MAFDFIISRWRDLVILALILILLVVTIVSIFKKRRGNKKLKRVVKDLRKSIREHHSKQARLFRAIDKTLSILPEEHYKEERRMKQDNGEEEHTYEYERDNS